MKGILLLGRDEVIESRAKRYKVALEHGDGLALPFEKTLITAPGTRIPWEWLEAGWGFLEKWDTAVPLWRYDMTAESVGTSTERALTQTVIRELRVLLHAVELLFVRRNEAGSELIEGWKEEMTLGPERRLAFLRAVYQVKPRLCVLPVSWLQGGAIMPAGSGGKRVIGKGDTRPLVMVEIAPGQLVKCHSGDEQQVKALMQTQRPEGGRRNARKNMTTVSKKSFVVDNQRTRANKGPLVRVELQPGRYVKMYETDAIAAGRLQPKPEKVEPKGRPTEGNKGRPATADKNKGTGKQEGEGKPPVALAGQADEVTAVVAEPDDFTIITGIGKATARLLGAHGIATLAQLKTADLNFLSSQQQQAVVDWIQSED